MSATVEDIPLNTILNRNIRGETMEGKVRKAFCTQCRKETDYGLHKIKYAKTIKDKDYSFYITSAVCSECGNEVNIPGLIDYNVKEIDDQYRFYEKLVRISDIEKLMTIYNMGKAPLSLALGFGEITISRYLDGQVPSKEYSDIIKHAIASPQYMKSQLNKNKNKIAHTAYDKAYNAANDLEKMFCMSDGIKGTVYYIFKNLEEVTPLLLQKLLYYVQGLNSIRSNKTIFNEDCRAWVHGPVYVEIYNLFKDFKYDPIDDARFAVLENSNEALTEDQKKVVDLVIKTFGMYSGKTLERITHKEEPWKAARKGYDEGIHSNEIISKESIREYFRNADMKYDLTSEEGVNKYIFEMLK